MPSIADVYVTILPETSRVAAGIRSALRSVDKDFYAAGKRAGREFKRGMGEAGVVVDADTSKARREVDSLRRDIRKPEKIKIEHDKSSFAAAATAARNLEQNFQTLAITAAAIPNSIASVGTAAMSLTGLIGLMPATIGGAALAFGSLKVATLGFGDAMKNIRDPEKFAESIAQLAPNAQGAANAIQGLMPQITQLKMTVQDAFFAGFGDQIKQLGSTYLPMFQGVMSQMAGSAGTALRSVGQMLTTPAMSADMSAMTGNMTSAFNILSQALAPVVKAFMDIGVVGSGFLPALADAATKAATAFASFIQNARETGELQTWIQTGIDSFKQLMDIAGNVGGIIGGIMKAAPEGGGLFTMVAQITQTLSDFVNSPAGQGAFNTFMTGMSQTISALMPVLGSFLQAIAPILGVIGQLAATVITAIAPSFTAWFNAMTPVVQQIANSLQPVMAALAPILQQVATVLATAMIQGIQTLLPVIGPFVQAFTNLLSAVGPLIPPLMQLVMSALPGMQQALALVLPVLTYVMNVMADMANRVVPFLAEVVGALAQTFTDRWQIISGAVQTAWTVMEPIFNLIIGGVQRVMDALDRIASNPLLRVVGGVLGGGAFNLATLPAAAPRTPLPAFGQPTAGGGADAQRIRRGRDPIAQQQPLLPPSAFPAAPTPPISNYVPPAPSSGSGGGGGGNTPAALSPTGVDWEAIAQAESGGNWSINTGNGYYGGLQFDLPTWQQFGGTDFAERPDLASKEQQIAVAERVPVGERANRWPNTYSQGAMGRPPAGSAAAAATAGGTSPYAAATPSSGAFSDEALLSMVPSGQYSQTGSADLAQGLGDCSSAVEDLVNMLQGNPTAGRSMSTANAAEWLTARGFVQGNMPGAFNVGFDGGHMEATLPGGTNFNWGSAEAAARGGRGGQGAASFPNQYYLPVSGGDTPFGLADPYSTGYSGDRSTREAQQKVEDTKQRIADEEAELQKLRMKPGASPADIAKQEREVAKARREHADALADLTDAQNKYNDAAGGENGGFSGENFMAGIAEFFGFDGSLFKNPADFGLMKFLGAGSKLRPAGGDGASLGGPGGGGGGGGLMDLITNVAQPFGALGVVPDRNAPGQFMPTMPETANAGGVVSRAFAPAGAPGPGNQIDNSININNPVGNDHLRESFQTAQAEQFPRMRQPLRNLPTGG